MNVSHWRLQALQNHKNLLKSKESLTHTNNHIFIMLDSTQRKLLCTFTVLCVYYCKYISAYLCFHKCLLLFFLSFARILWKIKLIDELNENNLAGNGSWRGNNKRILQIKTNESKFLLSAAVLNNRENNLRNFKFYDNYYCGKKNFCVAIEQNGASPAETFSWKNLGDRVEKLCVRFFFQKNAHSETDCQLHNERVKR
jgi:hypothetical protein